MFLSFKSAFLIFPKTALSSLYLGSVCKNINSKDCSVHRDSVLSRISSEVINGALGMIIVGTIGILSLVVTYFYSLHQPHSDSKLFDLSSLINIRECFLFHNLINQAVSAQSNKSIWWEKSWVHTGFLIFSAIVSLFILIKISNGLEGSSKQRKEEGEGKEEGLKIHGNRASIYPLNCVHGYVNLDEMGNVLQRNSSKPPRCLRVQYINNYPTTSWSNNCICLYWVPLNFYSISQCCNKSSLVCFDLKLYPSPCRADFIYIYFFPESWLMFHCLLYSIPLPHPLLLSSHPPCFLVFPLFLSLFNASCSFWLHLFHFIALNSC